MRRIVSIVVVLGALAASDVIAPRVVAQQSSTAQSDLLAEVRMLRQAIESLIGVNARVQIVFGRLQLQEQRTATAAQRLDQAREAAAKLTGEVTSMTDQLQRLEAAANESRRKPEEIDQLRVESTMVAKRLERLEQDRLRLVAAETEAAGVLNQEQGRWTDLNRQLEDLERALVKR